MSKKQIAKLLLALGIGVVTAASGVAVAGCNNNQGGNQPPVGGGEVDEYTVTFNLNGGSGTAPAAQTVESGDKLAPVADPTHPEGLEFDGWWTAAEGGTKWDFENSTVTGTITLYAHWKAKGGEQPGGEAEYEDVTTEVPLTELWTHFGNGSGNKLAEDYTVGAVTFSAGVYFDTTGGITGNTVNNQKKKIWFDLQGSVNSIKFDAKGGSSFTLILYKEDGTEVKSFGTITDPQLNLTAEELPAGKYYLLSEDGSGRLGNISYTQRLQKGTPASIEVKATEVDFLLNRTFGTTGVTATVTYTNGGSRAVNLTEANFNSSAVDMTKVGTYTVDVSYTENDETVHGSYEVNVYGVETIALGTYTTNGNKQTTFNQIYKVGGTFSTAGLTVVATAKCGAKEKKFVLNANEYTANTPDLTAVGAKDFTVTASSSVTGTGTAATATLPITVLGDATVENNTLTVSVDKNKEVSTSNFKTVTDALAYIGQLNLASDVVKVINIADGEYFEKVYINIPNVQLIGSDTVKPNHGSDNGVVIVYDALAGATDAAGHTYGTNGSATVTVGDGATDFVAKNITFKNFYNTFERYSESKNVMSDTQAVALLVESNKATFIGCKLTSYHDTLYSNKGNHYYEQCWIEGHTDYIFGQDANAYFNDCDIFSIGAGAEEKNGGYVTALKPSTANKYSFIYNHCRFDADENTKDGSIALGRAWGADMKMVVMNSTISAKFSTAAHTAGTGSGERYCTMSGNEPKPANMLEYNNTGASAITTSIDNTCTVIDATAAAAFDLDNLENIIGWNPAATYYTVTIHYGELTFTLSAKENSVLTEDQIKAALGGAYASYKITGVYTDSACQSAYDYEPVQSTIDLYVTLEEGDLIYDKTTTIDISDYAGADIQGNTGKYKGIEIDATASGAKFHANGNSVQINAGTKLTIKVVKGAELSIGFYPNYGSMDDVSVVTSDDTIEITVLNNNIYIISFTITYSTAPQPGESSGAIQMADNFGANGTEYKTNATIVDGDLFTVTSAGAKTYGVEAAETSPYAGKTVTAPDGETQLDFSTWLASNSNGAGYGFSIKANKKITLTIYYTFADSTMGKDSGKQGASPSYKEANWVITGDMTMNTNSVKSSGTAAYETLSLNLEAGMTINLDVSANRYVVFAMFAQVTGEGSNPVESKSWNVTVSGGAPSYTEGAGLTVEYVNAAGGNTSANSGDFKFDGNTAAVTLTLDNVKAGQTVTVTVKGYTGSNGKDVGLKYEATNAAATAGCPEKVIFDSTTSKTELGEGTFTFTVNEDGTVSIALLRSEGNTTRLVQVEITVA